MYLSRQIPLDPQTGELVMGGIEAQVRQVFENLRAAVGVAALPRGTTVAVDGILVL